MTLGSSRARIRVLVAKPGLDGHDRGAKLVAKALMDAGMEVIYTGLHRTVDQIVQAAIQEDVDVIGLSFLNGTHLPYTKEIMEKLRAQGAGDQLVVVGGIIPKADVPKLKALGVSEVFLPGTPLDQLVRYVYEQCRKERPQCS